MARIPGTRWGRADKSRMPPRSAQRRHPSHIRLIHYRILAERGFYTGENGYRPKYCDPAGVMAIPSGLVDWMFSVAFHLPLRYIGNAEVVYCAFIIKICVKAC